MSDSLIQRDAKYCWHPYTQHTLAAEPLPVVGAKGAWLELADGRRLLDGISSWWTNLHGHGHPSLVKALSQQAQTLDHVLFAGCTHEPAVSLSETLIGMTEALSKNSKQKLSRVFFSDNGSTAVEVALKAAYQSWLRKGEGQRTVFIALRESYHGDTFGAMAVGEPEPFFAEFKPFLFQVERVEATRESLEEALVKHAGKVAGFILEPLVQGAGGMIMHGPQFLRDARALCDEHAVLLIADEVMTGFGRTGTVFACEQGPICPDLLCLAKGLTGGMLPMSVTLATEEIYSAFLSDKRSRAFFHGHSLTANPLGCAVANASMALVKSDKPHERLSRIGLRIEEGLKEFAKDDGIKDLRRQGGIVALEIKTDDGGYLAGLGERLRAACRESEVLLRPLGNVLYALPPACVTDEEADLIAKCMIKISKYAMS
ncbi:MAG: adenosylmethionine--8-amino-7-oxononanoate transaminase [Planctomycetota bacterium]|nr:adenosylmethionine--8-amino-7-oxononanoate transaminase [Planctomycetota bacterium]